MKRLIITFITIFSLSFSGISQIESGEITYGIIRVFENTSEDNFQPVEYKNLKEKIESIVPRLEFVLKFNKTNSIFELKKGLAIDETELYTKAAIRIVRGDKQIYSNVKDKSVYEAVSFAGKNFLIQSSFEDLKWILTKESKKIGNYICYKATSFDDIVDHLNEKRRFNYTVWYCPSIPFNFGPYQYLGLPGLVLEFNNNKFVYTATQITLKNEKINIQIPKSESSIVTKDEYNKILKNAFEAKGF